MNILVTGAGLIGSNFTQEMIRQGHQVVLYDIAPNTAFIKRVVGEVPIVAGDIRDLPTLVETMQRHQINTVFHSAGLLGPTDERPYIGLSINIGGTIAVAEAARLTGVRRFVFASTFGVYQWTPPPKAPVSETHPLEGAGFYGGSKEAGERIVVAYGNKYGMEVAIPRFAGVYGAGHYAGGSSVGRRFHQLMQAVVSGGPVRIDAAAFGNYEYVYVKDIAQGLALASQRPLKSRTFNLGTGIVSTAADLAEALRTAFPKVEVEIIPAPPEKPIPDRQPLNLTRSKQELGYSPQFDLIKGLTDFANELRKAR
jgi:UDP-glucose 4-epimerase